MNYSYKFPRPAVSADIAVFRQTGEGWQILLILRKNEPYQGSWALPGGFMEMEETLEQAAARELEEETGLKNIELVQFHTYSQVNRDPRTRVITTVYYGITTMENSNAKGGDDAAEARWHFLNELPELAFDHQKIINLIKDSVMR